MIECHVCEGSGGYAIDYEAEQVESCANCRGSGHELCAVCNEPAEKLEHGSFFCNGKECNE